jgi:serine/threonine protein phosphatase PrpC
MQRDGCPRWAMHGASVMGASHVSSGLPNQDALNMRRGPEGSLPMVVCMSDGHGSDKCFRSDRGSSMAVEIAAELTWKLIQGSQQGGLSELKRAVLSDLPRNIVRRWRHKVVEHIRAHPFAEDELARLGNAKSPLDLNDFFGRDEFFLAYGATLVLAAVLVDCAFYLQLGDGDILVVNGDGRVEVPIPEDPTLMANETTSLCMGAAAAQFRTRLQVFSSAPPQLVMVSTDGYANSFASTEDFHRSAPDLRRHQPRGVATTSPSGSSGSRTCLPYRARRP